MRENKGIGTTFICGPGDLSSLEALDICGAEKGDDSLRCVVVSMCFADSFRKPVSERIG
jgi:hypothetical protein